MKTDRVINDISEFVETSNSRHDQKYASDFNEILEKYKTAGSDSERMDALFALVALSFAQGSEIRNRQRRLIRNHQRHIQAQTI